MRPAPSAVFVLLSLAAGCRTATPLALPQGRPPIEAPSSLPELPLAPPAAGPEQPPDAEGPPDDVLPPGPGSLPPVLTPQATPRASALPPLPGPPPRPRIALVLGGGAARGFAHVGVIRILDQEKVPIDLVVGTSVGSLIGAIYASNRSTAYLERTASRLQKGDIFDFGVITALAGMGLAKGDKLEKWVKVHVRTANIENLRIPFAAVATDLNWGEEVVLDKGPVARAVRASSAIPGVFQPVQHQGKLLVDGGVVDDIPIAVARAKGADLVIAVDIGPNVGNTRITNLVGVTLQAANIMFTHNVERSKRDADVLITPAIGDVGMLDFSQKRRCIRAGVQATRLAMPRIRKVIAAWIAAHSAPRPAGAG